MHRLLLTLMLLTGLNEAGAECSRPLRVPVAAIGLSVTTEGDTVGGVYPELLRALGEGCRFEFSVVPRARLELMFENGQADLLVPATRTPRRDELGVFIPMARTRATLISLNADRPPLRSLAELRERRELRVVLVRGFDYGERYQALVKDLTAAGRVSLAVDPIDAARVLQAGMADLSIMSPNILAGALFGDPRFKGLIERLRYEPVDELPWGESGIYLSKTALSEGDRNWVREALERSARSGLAWRTLQRHYPPAMLAESFRQR